MTRSFELTKGAWNSHHNLTSYFNKGSYESTREYQTSFGPSPLLHVLLHQPPPQPSASNSASSPLSNAVPMGKAGDVIAFGTAKIYAQAFCTGQRNKQEQFLQLSNGRSENLHICPRLL